MRFILLVLLIFVVVSCSSIRNGRVLSFFFDGVPVKDSLGVAGNSHVINDSLNTYAFRENMIVSNSDYVVHYPYEEKECYSCHNENSKSELLLPMPELCYTCHDDFSTKFKTVHGPVSAGYCTTCHNAHMSKEKSLLIRTGQQLCLFCHDSEPLLRTETHKDITDTECTLCHNPHGGEDRYILN